MPYKDIRKRKAYHKAYSQEWEKGRVQRRRDERLNSATITREMIFKALDIKPGKSLTWEQLVNFKVVKENTYAACVKKAKEVVGSFTKDPQKRFLLAQITVQACTIKKGGFNKGLSNKAIKKGERAHQTLEAFSKDIGIRPRTLMSWVNIYKFIVSDLKNKETVNWFDASTTLRVAPNNEFKHMSKKEIYATINSNPDYRQVYEILRSAKYTSQYLSKHGVKNFPKKVRESVKKHLELSLGFL